MRGGGPKLFCSPYFTVGAILLLLVMSVKYFSLSSEHDDLLLKVSVLQNQMKLTASNMRNLDSTLTKKEEAFTECNDEKNTIIERNKFLERDLNQREEELKKMQENNEENDVTIRNLNEKIKKFTADNNTMLEEVRYLKRRNEELSHNDEECQANRAKVGQLQGELNTLREQASALHKQKVSLKQNPEAEQPQGQLPDVNPGAVSIKQPALNGIQGHQDPILPRVDPKSEVLKPRLSLNGTLHHDEDVRQAIIEEEDEKEYDDQTTETAKPLEVVKDDLANTALESPKEDPKIESKAKKPLPNSVFWERKSKYEKKPVTEKFLDLSLLKRTEKNDQENSYIRQMLFDESAFPVRRPAWVGAKKMGQGQPWEWIEPDVGDRKSTV